jgi:DNA-binding CsgD family transcriptional regulator
VAESKLAGKAWQALITEAIEDLSKDTFYKSFCACCEFLTGYDSTLVVWLGRAHKPISLFDNIPERYSDRTELPWISGAYLLDPYYQLFLADSASGVYKLQDVMPDNFFETDYAKNYYRGTGLVDECGLLIRLSDEHAILVSLGLHSAEDMDQISTDEIVLALPMLATLCRKQQSALDGEINFSAPLDKAFRNFGRDHLSKREREVIQLLLKGHSNKSIAQLLDISVDTVKVFNKRFHLKLGISSQAELFSLFLESISMIPFDADIDPLTHYLEITRASS